jgi:hypothetical protein
MYSRRKRWRWCGVEVFLLQGHHEGFTSCGGVVEERVDCREYVLEGSSLIYYPVVRDEPAIDESKPNINYTNARAKLDIERGGSGLALREWPSIKCHSTDELASHSLFKPILSSRIVRSYAIRVRKQGLR